MRPADDPSPGPHPGESEIDLTAAVPVPLHALRHETSEIDLTAGDVAIRAPSRLVGLSLDLPHPEEEETTLDQHRDLSAPYPAAITRSGIGATRALPLALFPARVPRLVPGFHIAVTDRWTRVARVAVPVAAVADLTLGRQRHRPGITAH